VRYIKINFIHKIIDKNALLRKFREVRLVNLPFVYLIIINNNLVIGRGLELIPYYNFERIVK
jgi:hypothetical protein